MAKFRYRQIMKIMDLVEDKLLQLEKEKSNQTEKLEKIPFYVSKQAESEEDDAKAKKEMEIFTSRYDKIINEFQEIRDQLEAELDHLEFEFGVRERNPQWSQKNNRQDQNQNQPSQ